MKLIRLEADYAIYEFTNYIDEENPIVENMVVGRSVLPDMPGVMVMRGLVPKIEEKNAGSNIYLKKGLVWYEHASRKDKLLSEDDQQILDEVYQKWLDDLILQDDSVAPDGAKL